MGGGPGGIIGGLGGGSGGSSGGSTSGGSSGGSSSGGSTSTSSSSGGSSGPSAAQIRAEQRAMQNLRLSFLEILRRLGFAHPNKNLMNLVEKAARGQWSSLMFQARLRHTPEYHKRFQGIQTKTGMTEGQYLSTFAQYKARAQDIGLKLTREDFAKLLKRGVTFDEYSDRIDALQSYKQYQPMWTAFQQVLEERGIPVPGGSLGKKEMVDFIMGQGSAQYEKAWQETILTTNLEKVAGIGVIGSKEFSAGPSAYEITRGDLLHIINSIEGLSGGKLDLEDADIDFAGLGERLRKYDRQYLNRYGITTKDIVNAELGGPGAAEMRTKLDRIVKEKEAFYEPRALPSYQRAQQKQQQEEFVQSQ